MILIQGIACGSLDPPSIPFVFLNGYFVDSGSGDLWWSEDY